MMRNEGVGELWKGLIIGKGNFGIVALESTAHLSAKCALLDGQSYEG